MSPHLSCHIAAIVLSEPWAPVVQALFVIIPAAIMILLLLVQARRMRRTFSGFDKAFTGLLPWREDAFSDLCWLGDYARSSGPFRSRLRFVLNSLANLQREDKDEPFILEGGRRGPASFELRTTGLPQPLLVWRRRATLRTPRETVTLQLHCGLPFPILRRARVEVDGAWLGDFEAGQHEILLRDRSGEIIGSWRTETRLLANRDDGRLRRGELRLRGGLLAKVIVPTLPLWNVTLRSQTPPLCEHVLPQPSAEQRHWLIATLALTCYGLAVSRGFASRQRSPSQLASPPSHPA